MQPIQKKASVNLTIVLMFSEIVPKADFLISYIIKIRHPVGISVELS